ncbi:Nucleoside phosphorylase domain [Macleaya cordata]|uniref:Nucleoside phosphorylase domain n=1 Tax=Macleaya cordata TaxID=56857 RepID=A0A200QDV6_MACCD|nr:Nucleoside phosphorylase domain [Macleaya cordata]
MMMNLKVFILGFVVYVLLSASSGVDGEVVLNDGKKMREIEDINRRGGGSGSYLGLVVPNAFEMGPLLQSPSFVADQTVPYLDFSGRRFRIGRLGNESVIIVMTGLGMLNAGVATELLLTLFKVKAVLHFGIAGNANPNLQIGDVVIPHYWAHTGLWNWQRFGDGPNDELALESNGDYTRKIGYINFSDYNNHTKNENSTSKNLLNNVWYQPEEIFPIDGTPEVRQHAFWVPVDDHHYAVAQKLEDMKLEGCINSTCLPRPSMVRRVERGSSANVFVDNGAYREFVYSKFNFTSIDMDSAAVALTCLQQRTPFIVIRALSDLAGGGSSESNEAAMFAPLAAQNAVSVLLKFITLLS